MREIFFLLIVLFLNFPGFAQTKSDLLGTIIPLHSTRADVEKRFKPSSDQLGVRPQEGRYRSSSEEITIEYAQAPCIWHGWNVKPDTVINIRVEPLNRISFDFDNFDLTQFMETSDDIGSRYLTNAKAGVEYTLDPGDILRYSRYFPTEEDSAHRCSGYPEFSPFSYEPQYEFKVASLPDMSVGLLADTIYSSKKENFTGYIFIYYTRGLRKDASILKKNIEKYAFEKLKGDPDKLRITIGGIRDRAEIITFLLPTKYPPPVSRPKYGGV